MNLYAALLVGVINNHAPTAIEDLLIIAATCTEKQTDDTICME